MQVGAGVDDAPEHSFQFRVHVSPRTYVSFGSLTESSRLAFLDSWTSSDKVEEAKMENVKTEDRNTI